MLSEQLELHGIVRKIIHPKNKEQAAGDFYVFSLLLPDKTEETVCGSMFGVQEKDELTIWGERAKHPKFGWQIKMERYEKPVPTTEAGLVDYLSSGLVKGVGPVLAKRLVDAFGKETLDIAQNNPQRLIGIKGISPNKANVISAAITETIAFQQVLSFLIPLNVTPKTALKAFKKWGGGAIEQIKKNPYCMTDIKMVGFARADEIAWELGISLASPFRVQAAILHVLREAANKRGHCYLPTDELIKETLEILNTIGINDGSVRNALKTLAKQCRLIYETSYTQLYEFALAESNVRARLKQMSVPMPSVKGIESATDWYESKKKIKLADLQKKAVVQFFNHKAFILTGGPGTGKTETVRSICDIAQRIFPTAQIELAAPTGRASRRMAEVTGRHAVTIHRMLGLRGNEEDDVQRIKADILIVDEFSMMDLFLTDKLLKALPDTTRLLIVGDTDQLPSVGPGNVLKDLIQYGVPHVRLTEIFRQAKDSQIVTNAHRINAGETCLETGDDFFFVNIEEPAKIREKIIELAAGYFKKHGNVDGLQILSPMKKGQVGVEILNEKLQATLNPPAHHKPEIKKHVTFRVGDRVLQTMNDYEKGVFNGDVGIVKTIKPNEEGDQCVFVDYPAGEVQYYLNELDALTLAYAMSVHKSQGSEYPVVITPVTTSHYIMLARNLIYTAVTRASEKAIMVGTRKAHAVAVKNNNIQTRYTMLAR